MLNCFSKFYCGIFSIVITIGGTCGQLSLFAMTIFGVTKISLSFDHFTFCEKSIRSNHISPIKINNNILRNKCILAKKNANAYDQFDKAINRVNWKLEI